MQSVPFNQASKPPSERTFDADDLSAFSDARRIHIRSIQMLFGVGLFPAIMQILIVFVVGWVLWDANSPYEIVPWVIVLTTVITCRAFLVLRHGGDKFDPNETDRLLRLFNLTALGVGLSWGSAGWFLFPEGDPGRQIFLTFVIGGMAMSSVSSIHVPMRTCLMAVVPDLLPLSVRYMIEPGDLNMIYGGLLLAYTMVLVTAMRRQSRFALKLFGLQVENEKLLEVAAGQAVELDVARQSAESANIAKSRFLAQASHDLRQPLHAINLYFDALPVPEDGGVSTRIIGRVRQSLDVLSRLFDSLLDVTLLDTGQIKVRPIVFRPGDLLVQIRDEFSGVAEVAQVDIRVRSPALAVTADPVLLRRILQNLCSNAIRYAEGGMMLIAVRKREGAAVIEVYDTGGGIPEEDQIRVFEEFTRLDPARMGGKAAPGLGLGLAIVKRLADVMNVSVTVRSRKGVGTRFQISGLPLAPLGQAINLQEEEMAVGDNAFGDLKLLIIDDDQDTLDATCELLGKWGCTIELMLGWTGAPQQVPDVVICDYELGPGFTGFDALEKLAGVTGKNIPTIMISGNSTPELHHQAEQRGLPLIHKPVRPGQLRSALLHAISRLRQAEG